MQVCINDALERSARWRARDAL